MQILTYNYYEKYYEKSKHRNFEQYEYLMTQHDCQINHLGSSGKMESDAVTENALKSQYILICILVTVTPNYMHK